MMENIAPRDNGNIRILRGQSEHTQKASHVRYVPSFPGVGPFRGPQPAPPDCVGVARTLCSGVCGGGGFGGMWCRLGGVSEM